MIKIKKMIDTGDVNVDVIITTDHTGEEQDFPVCVSRELLAKMTPLELKTLLMGQYDTYYRVYLDAKIDELIMPLIGVDFSEEDVSPLLEPEEELETLVEPEEPVTPLEPEEEPVTEEP